MSYVELEEINIAIDLYNQKIKEQTEKQRAEQKAKMKSTQQRRNVRFNRR